VKVIKDLQDKLKKLDVMSNLVPITTAKVPILKFYHIPSELEGDISIYNTLGQQNTKLLRVYAEIDPRAKVCVHYVLSCYYVPYWYVCLTAVGLVVEVSTKLKKILN
jgi:hypothetical protein